MASPRTNAPDLESSAALDCFPDRPRTGEELRRLLAEGTPERRAWVISQLLSYAEYDEIWRFVSREEVRAILPDLELSDRLRAAWTRLLQVDDTKRPNP